VKTSYLPLEEIERRVNDLIWKYEGKYGSVSAPIPVEGIAENIVDLVLEWSRIPEKCDEIIFAGFNPTQKKVIFNERRRNYYDDTDGLYNTVLAHELGHWILHVDAIELGLQPMLLGTEVTPKYLYRSTGPSKPLEWQAHTFMGYLLLPYRLLKNHIESGDIYTWNSLYYLKEKFDVTISALVIRLKKMGLIYIDDDKNIYQTKAEYNGQIKLV